MKNDNIEDKIKERLLGHEAFINTDELLQSMDLDEKDSRKPLFWMWFGGLCVFIIIGYSVISYQVQKNSKTILTELQQEFKKINNQQILNKRSNINNQAKVQEELINENNKTVEPKNSLSEKTNSLPRQNINDRKSTNEGEDEPFILQTKLMVDNEITFYARGIVDVFDDKDGLNVTTKFATLEANNRPFMDRLIQDVDMLDIYAKFNRSTPIFNFLELKKAQTDESLIPNKKDWRGKWSLLPYVGFSKFNQIYKSKTDDQNYTQLRSNKENALEKLEFGVNANYHVNNKWYFKSGLAYERYNSKLTYQELFRDSTLIEGVVRYNISYDGDTIPTNGPLLSFEVTNRSWEVFNKLEVLSIPLAVGYNQTFSDWNVYVESGLITNVYTSFSGELLNKFGGVDVDRQVYKKAFHIQYVGAVGVGYKLNDDLNLWMDFNYRQSINSMTKSNYELDERQKQFGINAGIKYQIE